LADYAIDTLEMGLKIHIILSFYLSKALYLDILSKRLYYYSNNFQGREGQGMYFNDYLKKCREKYNLTQGELVVELSHFDEELFKSLDNVTLSRWELGKSSPNIARQIQTIKYFQSRDDLIFPCFDESESEMIERHVCKTGMLNLPGKNKSLILNFPSSISVDELAVHQLKDSVMIDEKITIALDLNKEFSHNHSLIDRDRFKEWTLSPDNLFLICEYNKQFFGLLFSLRLKPESFDKLMNFKITQSDIMAEDFAGPDEMGCNFILAFFAMNEMAASLLLIRYFAHLITDQKKILEIGSMSTHQDAITLMESINLQHCKSKKYGKSLTRHTYRASLSDVLINETMIRLLFAKEDCSSGE
jgi:transcriptional regulator with XRE-family HTH domain